MTQQTLFTDEALHTGDTQTLSQLRERAAACRECKLCESRAQAVFGVGNPDRPKVAFIGEAPGEREDQQGKPFVGPAGMLLDKMIAKMGLNREQDCYILNAVCCRPPGNRVPEAEELLACRPFFHGQLRLIRPQAIITLGATAAVTLLRKEKPMRDLRGKWHEWESIPVRPTFHPSYLLREPKERASAMVDLDAVTRFLRTGVTIGSFARKDL